MTQGKCDDSTMERVDLKSPRANKRRFLMVALGAAVVAGVVAFLIMILVLQLQSGTSGLIGAGVAVVVGGIAAAVASPTPHRER